MRDFMLASRLLFSNMGLLDRTEGGSPAVGGGEKS